MESIDQKSLVMTVPGFRLCPDIKLNMSAWQVATGRLKEVQNLAAANYSNLEFCFQEAWREARANSIIIGDAIRKAKQNIEEIKADVVLTEIPELLRDSPKSANNADFRNAVLARNEQYKQANEHLDKLEAMLAHCESHMKIMENTSRFMKKQMDYFIRNGTSGIYQR